MLREVTDIPSHSPPSQTPVWRDATSEVGPPSASGSRFQQIPPVGLVSHHLICRARPLTATPNATALTGFKIGARSGADIGIGVPLPVRRSCTSATLHSHHKLTVTPGTAPRVRRGGIVGVALPVWGIYRREHAVRPTVESLLPPQFLDWGSGVAEASAVRFQKTGPGYMSRWHRTVT